MNESELLTALLEAHRQSELEGAGDGSLSTKDVENLLPHLGKNRTQNFIRWLVVNEYAKAGKVRREGLWNHYMCPVIWLVSQEED